MGLPKCHTHSLHDTGFQIVVGCGDINSIVSRLWKAQSQGNGQVFSKGEIIRVTNNNIYSYLSLDKGN